MSQITLLETVGSTNDVAMQAAKKGAEHGSCWVADEQTAGRGRRDTDGARRAWHSPAGTGVYMSIVLRPELSLAEATAVPLVAAVGVRRAVEESLGLDPWIKWPNDLYVGERKLCGILSEAYTQGMALEAIVVGMGININLAPEDVPAELEGVLTSARIEAGRVFDRMAFALAMRRHVVRALDAVSEAGLGAVIEELRRYDRTVGRAVEVTDGTGWARATSRGITDDGRLSVELEDGGARVLNAGEVRFPRGVRR